MVIITKRLIDVNRHNMSFCDKFFRIFYYNCWCAFFRTEHIIPDLVISPYFCHNIDTS